MTDRFFVREEATVDLAGLTIRAGRQVELALSPAEAGSLTSCRVEYFQQNNTELQVSGVVAPRFQTISTAAEAQLLRLRGGTLDGIRTTEIMADSALFASDVDYSLDFTADYLSLAAGTTHRLQADLTLTTNAVEATGLCTAPIQLLGASNGTFTAPAAAPLNLAYLYVENIRATGGADFTASDSYGRRSPGWNFTNDGPGRYWVGGTGNWNDPAHWSSVSGGAPGACPPGPANDAIFDANSFAAAGDTVYLPAGPANVGTLDWRANDDATVLLTNNATNLSVYGSLYLHPDLEWAADNPRRRISLLAQDAGWELLTYGKTQLHDLFFNGTGGTWDLRDSLEAAFTIDLNRGTLNTNGHSLALGNLNLSSRQFRLDLSDSYVYVKDFTGTNLDDRTEIRLWGGNNGDFGYFVGADVTVINRNAGGVLSIDLRNANGRPNHLRAIYSSGFLNLRTNDFAARVVDLREGANLNFNGAIDSLFLAAGNNYVFGYDNTDVELSLGHLSAPGNCFEPIGLRSGGQVTFRGTTPQRGTYLNIENVGATGTTWEAESSLDLGNAGGWTFSGAQAPRTLYWVGGGGSWFDAAHWALTSGGPGGNCLPTQIDAVVVDENSFTTAGDTLFFVQNTANPDAAGPTPVCRSIDVRELAHRAQFLGQTLELHGNAYFSDSVVYALRTLRLLAADDAEFLPANCTYGNIFSGGPGGYTLLGGINFRGARLSVGNGYFRTDGHDLLLQHFHINDTPFGSPITTTVDLADSEVTVTSIALPFYMGAARTSIVRSNGARVFIVEDAGAYVNTLVDGLDIEFLSTDRSSSLRISGDLNLSPTANLGTVFFRGAGQIFGSARIDSLQLTKGFSYRFPDEPTELLIEQELRAVGTACSPISIAPNSSTE
ncbi:MAG: hypothetical protein AAFN92_07950, partial [Bacteroidota bacterium]